AALGARSARRGWTPTAATLPSAPSAAGACSSVFFRAPPTTTISTLSLHDALPISFDRDRRAGLERQSALAQVGGRFQVGVGVEGDRKSTRLNSSHVASSYAVFCLKKKKTTT